MSNYLPCIEIEPGHRAADAAVIWLHGLGADGHDFEGMARELDLSQDLAVRFILPHAPSMPVSINDGYVMPAWYDILTVDEENHCNVHQLLASALAVHALLDREIERGIRSERLILVGFSQGGAVNYQAALTYDKPLGGLMALSSYFPTADAIELHPANYGLPIEIIHGSDDPVIPVVWGEHSKQRLEALGFHPEFHTYPMQHEVCAEEVEDIARFIRTVLK